VKNNFSKFALLRWLLPTFLVVLLTACAARGVNGLAPEGKTLTSLSSVTHYGKGIGVSEFYVNGKWGGAQYNGWGGGGATVCCLNCSGLICPDTSIGGQSTIRGDLHDKATPQFRPEL
jgi:hypothetical protein